MPIFSAERVLCYARYFGNDARYLFQRQIHVAGFCLIEMLRYGMNFFTSWNFNSARID